MRLINAKVASVFIDDSIERSLQIVLDDDGVQNEVSTSLPVGWDGWTRSEKVQWIKNWLVNHSQTHRYLSGADIVFPDATIKNIALGDFDNLPGFATWTTQEAVDWIDTNVNDLDTAKVALARIVQAIVYLRDIVIRKI